MTGTAIPRATLRSTPHRLVVHVPALLAMDDDVNALAVLVPVLLPTLLTLLPLDVVDTVVPAGVVDAADVPVVTLVHELLIVLGVASGELATHWALGHSLQPNGSTTWHSSRGGQARHVGMTCGHITHPLCRGTRTMHM